MTNERKRILDEVAKSLTANDIRDILTEYKPDTRDWAPGLTPAAVLALFYSHPDGLSLIFTKRTEHLDNHGGQISFPGGRRDPEDCDLLSTALRETQEEIGTLSKDIEVWGRLNQEATITRFTVAPFVGFLDYPYEFKLDSFEVERLIIVPLDHLLDPQNVSVTQYPWEGRLYDTFSYQYKDDVIWGATARIVNNLITLLITGREPARRGFIKKV